MSYSLTLQEKLLVPSIDNTIASVVPPVTSTFEIVVSFFKPLSPLRLLVTLKLIGSSVKTPMLRFAIACE